MPDPEPDTLVTVAAQRGDRTQAVMAGIAATRLHAELRGREIELIMERDHVADRQLEEAHGLPDRPARLVHEGLGLQQHDLLVAELHLGGHALEALAPGLGVVAAGDRGPRHETDIVAIARIARARIAEPDENTHLGLRPDTGFGP